VQHQLVAVDSQLGHVRHPCFPISPLLRTLALMDQLG
jgi:hypothetical protein